jgi:hypothetical protein
MMGIHKNYMESDIELKTVVKCLCTKKYSFSLGISPTSTNARTFTTPSESI